ncbi:hypothetical protein [Bacillus phage CM1]|nr:hypothetical protein [Bacillus phage CM1]
MTLAKELWKLAMSKLAKDSKSYIDKIKREARKAAEQSRMCIEVELPVKARHVKDEIANELHEEDFTVVTKYFPKTGSFYVIVDWTRETPLAPEHIDYTGY